MPLKNGKPKEYASHAADEVFETSRPILEVHYRDGSKGIFEYKHIFSGASAVSILDRASDCAIKRGIEGKNSDLTREDISAGVQAEYSENRKLTNLITPEDMQAFAGERAEQIVDVRPSYLGSAESSAKGKNLEYMTQAGAKR